MKWAKSVGLWLIPVVIFYAIWRHLNLAVLKAHLELVNPWLVCVGLTFSPVLVFLAGVRWRGLLVPHLSHSIGLWFFLKHLWIGMSLGVTGTPLAGDVYRAIVAGRRVKRYRLNIFLILAEKIIMLLACALLIVGLYPLLDLPLESEVHDIVRAAWIVGILLLIGLAALATGLFHFHDRAATMITSNLNKMVRAARDKGWVSESLANDERPDHIVVTIRKLLAPSSLALNVSVSLTILLVAALANQVFFWAADYEIPFLANLFVIPALYVILNLPISVIAARLGAYVLLYGAFGVDVETALLVSFFSAAAVLVNYIIGGLLVLGDRLKRGRTPLVHNP